MKTRESSISFFSATAAALTLVFFGACTSEDDPGTARSKTGGSKTGGSAESPEHPEGTAPGGGLRLDNGARWKANESTHVGMGNMQKLLTDFAASAAKDYTALGESLRAETNVIVKECTMIGAAHEQLHLVLIPILEAIDKLVSGSGGSDEYNAVRKHVQDYHSHFEL